MVTPGDPAVIALKPQGGNGPLGKRSAIVWLVLLAGAGCRTG
jgi:hypothetical protein